MTTLDPQRFAEALGAAEAAIDWAALEPVYCEGDAQGFFSEERLDAVRDAGLRFASDLAELLAPRGRSLYVGAGVAELAPLLLEAVGLGRKVTVHGLAGAELEQLEKAMQAAREATGSKVPRITDAPIRPGETGPVDHLWIVSVLTDPVAFPALHDRLYGRQGGPEAVGGGHPAAERRRAGKLLSTALGGLVSDAVVTTTDEELPLFEEPLAALGQTLVSPQIARLSGLVGDPVRHHRLRKTPASGR